MKHSRSIRHPIPSAKRHLWSRIIHDDITYAHTLSPYHHTTIIIYDISPGTTVCYWHGTSEKYISQELTYKELDGAVPGSRDLITYDSIHDLPDIPVEVWNMSANPAETSEISDPSVKGYNEDPPAPGGAVGEKRFEARAVSEEVSEYLQSQGLFSYETGSPVEDMSSLYAQEWNGGWKQNEDCIP